MKGRGPGAHGAHGDGAAAVGANGDGATVVGANGDAVVGAGANGDGATVVGANGDAVVGAGADRGWLLLTAVLIGGSVLAMALPAAWLDWQPSLAVTQPWRAWTAAWLHWSEQHLGANLLAGAVVGAYGWTAQVPRAQTWAWAAAWPLTHLGLLSRPELLHYGGLSGVLHAGVAIVCLHLLVHTRGRRRWIGAGVALGLVIKLISEKPWGAVLQRSADWDITLAPLAHATGALAGVLCGAVALRVQRQLKQPPQNDELKVR